LYRLTGEQQYLAIAEREWKGVIDSGNALIGGVIPEMLAPMIKRDEGCSEADWLRLSFDLWQVTRKPEYLKQAEISLFNEFSFNQFSTGDFGHHTLERDGMAPPYARAWWCCTFHGLRAMIAAFRAVFHEQDGIVSYDLPVDGRFDSNGLSLRADSTLHLDSAVKLTVVRADGKAHTLQVRVPDWASSVSLSAAGSKLNSEPVSGYLSSRRVWRAGEQIVVKYVCRTRIVPNPEPPARVAVMHGPWLLAVHEEMSPTYFDEPWIANKVELPASGEFRPEHVRDSASAGAFAVPAAHFKLRYLPGGYPMQPATTVLKPLAEFTGSRGLGRVEFWFPLRAAVERQDAYYNQ
jgi:DUF1680 family protein